MRCAHNTGAVVSFMTATGIRRFVNGVFHEGGCEDPVETGVVEVQCFGCKKVWKGDRYGRKKPKWCQVLLDIEAGNGVEKQTSRG